jgi:type IV pilus assembly protein PilN
MIRINLLPYRAARKKENIRIQVNVFLGTLIFIALAIVWCNTYLSGRVSALQAEINSIQTEMVKYEQINKEIAEIKKKLELLNRKIEVIESLERDRKAPVINLDSLYHQLVEKRMWYTQLEEKGSSIKISGIAVDNQTVADYMTRIEKTDRFENVRLVTIKQQKLKATELSLMQFDVDFQKKNFAKTTVEDKTKGKK